MVHAVRGGIAVFRGAVCGVRRRNLAGGDSLEPRDGRCGQVPREGEPEYAVRAGQDGRGD